MATPREIRDYVDSTRPKDWYGKCAGLTYRTIADNGGYAPDIYPSAKAAYNAALRAGKIKSTRSSEAPAGAIHYWSYFGTDYRGIRDDWGHVAIDIYGGGTNLLSATGYAHQFWGVRAGLITEKSQSSRAGMRYLGWSMTYGARNYIWIGEPETPAGEEAKPTIPEPVPVPEEEEDDMKPTVHVRLDANGTPDDWTLAHPEIGLDLPLFTGTATDQNSRLTEDGQTRIFRGFMATKVPEKGYAWARTHAKGIGGETSRLPRPGIVSIQLEASALSVELHK